MNPKKITTKSSELPRPQSPQKPPTKEGRYYLLAKPKNFGDNQDNLLQVKANTKILIDANNFDSKLEGFGIAARKSSEKMLKSSRAFIYETFDCDKYRIIFNENGSLPGLEGCYRIPLSSKKST